MTTFEADTISTVAAAASDSPLRALPQPVAIALEATAAAPYGSRSAVAIEAAAASVSPSTAPTAPVSLLVKAAATAAATAIPPLVIMAVIAVKANAAIEAASLSAVSLFAVIVVVRVRMMVMTMFCLLLVAVVLVPMEHEGVVPSTVVVVAVLVVRREEMSVVGSVQREVAIIELPGCLPEFGLKAQHVLIPHLVLRFERPPRQDRPRCTQPAHQATAATPCRPLH